jgi:hypothetical protein
LPDETGQFMEVLRKRSKRLTGEFFLSAIDFKQEILREYVFLGMKLPFSSSSS